MLNENLSRIRKERGLTQEALATKLHVVRQTISKWENGTAVPDADTLCRIADALDISVSELLDSPVIKDQMDTTTIAKSLAEINEQLAIRNRRSSLVFKIICGFIIGLSLLTVIIVILYISITPPVIENGDIIIKVKTDEANAGTPIELDNSEVPLFSQINQSNEHALQEFFRSKNITDKQLIQSWGTPINDDGNKISWKISDKKVITVFFYDTHYAYDCGIEDK